MLKKLTKYGNSTTLIIDKAVLELLNMDESGLVKLRTDGRSLIITPVKPGEDQAKISDLQRAIQSELDKQPEKEASIEEFIEVKDAFGRVFAKHAELMHTINKKMAEDDVFQDEVSKLAQKHDPVNQPKEYIKAYQELRKKYYPEVSEMDEEIKRVSEKFSKISN